MADKNSWIYGINPVREALNTKREIETICVKKEAYSKKIRELLSLAKIRNISIRMVDRDFFNMFSRVVHQDICALVKMKKFLPIDDLLEDSLRKTESPLFVLLDGVEDPRNLGAILRVSECADVDGVVLQSRRAAGITPAAVKASSGAVEYVPISIAPNIKHAIKLFKENGIYVIGAEAGSDESIWDTDLTIPISIVFGSEGKGLRRTVKDSCDLLLELPLYGKINSLNVSVAAGVFLFECKRQRLKGRNKL